VSPAAIGPSGKLTAEEAKELAAKYLKGHAGPRSNTAFHGHVLYDGSHESGGGYGVCHSQLAANTKHRAAIYIPTMRNRLGVDKEAAIRFYAWLFGPASPYRTIMPPLDPEEVFEHGFVVGDLDKHPANLVYNMVIASRFAYEFQGQVSEWKRRVDLGVHPGLAYWSMFIPPSVNNPNCNHQAFDWRRVSEDYVKNLCNGTPANPSGPYNTHSVFPCNVVWGDKSAGGNTGNMCAGDVQLLDTWRDLYPEFHTEINQRVGDAHPSAWGRWDAKPEVAEAEPKYELVPGPIKSMDALMSILLKEQQRLGLENPAS